MPTSKTSTSRPGATGADPAAAFRASFLASLPPQARETLLQQTAFLLQGLAATGAAHEPTAPGEPPARAGLRAAAADLRHLEDFVARVTRRCEEGVHPEEDLRHVVVVSKLAGTLGRLAGALEKALRWKTGAVYLEP